MRRWSMVPLELSTDGNFCGLMSLLAICRLCSMEQAKILGKVVQHTNVLKMRGRIVMTNLIVCNVFLFYTFHNILTIKESHGNEMVDASIIESGKYI